MAPPPPPLVVIADDRRVIRNGYAALIAEAGFQALQAADGDEALDLVRQHRVDCLVLDIDMPGGGGFAVLEALGLPERATTMRVILMDRDPGAPDLQERAAHFGVPLIEKFPDRVIDAVRKAAC